MKVRIRFTKLGKIRFLGHRDLARCWERAIRRVELPVAYSEGFSPRPRLHYGLALPTGAESLAEYLDVDLSEDVELDGLAERLSAAMPEGVDVTGIAEVPSNATALQAVVEHSTWEIELVDVEHEAVVAAVAAALDADDVPLTFERKGKSLTENVRPALLSVTVEPELREEAVVIRADLATRPRSIRPSELLTCLGDPGTPRRIRRIEQWTSLDGSAGAGVQPPLAAAGASPPVDERLAS